MVSSSGGRGRFVARVFAVACLAGTGAAVGAAASANDMEVVKSRMLAGLVPSKESEPAAITAAQGLAATLQPNGTWPDIDYREFRRASWPMVGHLVRVSSMAAAWRGGSSTSSDPKFASLLAGTKLALELWLKNDWKNPNWYDNEIGVPNQMGNIGLLLQPALSTADASKMEEIMSRADWKGSGTVANPRWTGANLLDMLRIQIRRGLFANSSSLVGQGFARSFAAVVHSHQSEDSIMVDNSFHQHGPQLLAAAYGAVFTSDILDLACTSAGTAFQMPAPAIQIFEGLVLDGQARMSRAGSWDWQVHGRGISIDSGMAIGFATDQLRTFADQVSPHRAEEWRAFAHRIDSDDASDAAALTGNRGFWSSDYMSHGQRDFLFTIHMFSARTIPAACVNDQGKLDRHLSDGGTALYKTGHEYDGVFPCWNWTRPPGTTVATAAASPSCGNAKHRTSATFVGSASDGTHGVAVQQLLGHTAAEYIDTVIDGDFNCSKSGGIQASGICCLKSCGLCSGDGCSRRKGGAEGCCSSEIHRRCSSTVGPPCRTDGQAPGPSPTPDVEPDANANKTWLLFDRAIIATGRAELPKVGGLVTSVEQMVLRGPVHIGNAESASVLADASQHDVDLSKAGAWVLHDGVGYLLPQTAGAVMHVSNTNKTGTWSSIGVGSDTPVTRPVFDLYISHADEYRYTILPANNSVTTMPTSLSVGAGYTLAGGGDSGFCAALDPSGTILLGAVWADEGVAVNIGCWSVTSSRASAFVLHRLPNSTLQASASVPGADGGNLTLVIDDSSCESTEEGPGERGGYRSPRLVRNNDSVVAKSREPGCKAGAGGALELEFSLPSGDFSGSSVSVACATA